MWFLIRSVFWLGLTFSYLDGLSVSTQVADIASATKSVTQTCLAMPDVCRAAARSVAPAAVLDSIAVDSSGPHAGKKLSVDTLRASDKAAAWRGRG